MTDVDLAALRAGRESAFRDLVRQYHPSLMRTALAYSPSRAVAEETVQETWLAVLRGLDGFRAEASFRTWVYRILVNTARLRASREGRSVPFSGLVGDNGESGPTVSPDRFYQDGPYAGHWRAFPAAWSTLPEERLLSREMRSVATTAIARLVPDQRIVITLRDVEGWTAPEVCDLLGIDSSRQRLLLHRARSRVRQELEGYLAA
jgi:RNA polymerase sigma-70 factor (ECF subfamily)